MNVIRLTWKFRYHLILALIVAGVFALNYWCVPAHDELAYAFQGECTPILGEAHHVGCMKDIVDIQLADYRHGPNGRIFLHSVVCCFSGWELYTLFDVVNTMMWFLLVWLVLHEGGVKVDSARKFVLGAVLCFCFIWNAETCSQNAAFAVNYLWSAVLTILFVRLWRRKASWWTVPLSFVYGWWMEVFSMPMIAALGSCFLVETFRRHRFPWTCCRFANLVALGVGGLGCCGSHLVSGRAEGTSGLGLVGYAVAVIKAQLGLVLSFWPIALLVLLVFVLWRRRKTLVALYDESPEWWMYLFYSLGVCVVLGQEGIRMACPLSVCGVILLLQNRAHLSRFRRALMPLATLTLAVLCVCVYMQREIGEAVLNMEHVYAQDSQGVTYRPAFSTGPLKNSIGLTILTRWHRGLFRHKFKKDVELTVLSPYLYHTLYLEPARFFKEAKQVGDNLFVSSQERRYVVQRGGASLTDVEQDQVERYLNVGDTRAGWQRFLPGRLAAMFMSSDYYVGGAGDVLRFRAKDGHVYTVHIHNR